MITRKLILTLLGGMIAWTLIFVACSEDRITEYDVHPTGWMDKYNPEFHGTAAIATGGESCGYCHALQNTLDEASAENAIGCYECHGGSYPHLWASRVPGHRQAIEDNEYDLSACAECHGANFTGGNTGVSCLECHTTAAGVSDCNLCHGQPPVGNDGLPATFDDGAFGAHETHSRYACTECHAPVNNLDHIDDPPADLDFRWAEIATLNHSSPVATPSGLPDGNTGCGSIYCHGGEPVNWLGDPIQCGTCHGIPPATDTHPQDENRCHICHRGVDPNSNYSTPEGIVFLPEYADEHVNGVVDFH